MMTEAEQVGAMFQPKILLSTKVNMLHTVHDGRQKKWIVENVLIKIKLQFL